MRPTPTLTKLNRKPNLLTSTNFKENNTLSLNSKLLWFGHHSVRHSSDTSPQGEALEHLTTNNSKQV